MTKSLFITATGTDVGKTFVSALIVKKLHQDSLCAGYYKPLLSGLELPVLADHEYVQSISGIEQGLDSMVSYTYNKAVSPHLAAQLEGNPLELSVIRQRFAELSKQYEYLTVEGCGGIICPLRYDHEQKIFLQDIIKTLGLQVVLVTTAQLGSINSTILTIEYLRQQNITIAGLIINNYLDNDTMQQDNYKMLTELSQLQILATVAPNAQEINIDIQQLTKLYKEGAL